MKYILTLLLLVSLILLSPRLVLASKTYDTPEEYSSRPRNPDVLQDQGANLHRDRWELIVAPNTFTYDVYFRKGCRKKGFPLSIRSYWQVTDICEFTPLSHFNGAAAEVQRAWIISYHYSDDELGLLGGISFPENSLKIVFTDDNGKSWEMLKSSTVDADNNTVAAITDKPGGYMIMAGFVNPKSYYSYHEVLGATSKRNSIFELFWKLLSHLVI